MGFYFSGAIISSCLPPLPASMQVLDANKCFEKRCHSALSLQLAAYYYSLQIYSLLSPCFKNKNHALYQVCAKYISRLRLSLRKESRILMLSGVQARSCRFSVIELAYDG